MAKRAAKAESAKASEFSNKKEITIIVVFTAIVASILLVMNAGSLVKTTTEKIASEALGVKVSIERLDISLQEKQATLSGLHIANPPGYKGVESMSADRILIKAEDFTREKIVFDEIKVTGTTFNLETGHSTANLTDLRALIREKMATRKDKPDNSAKIIARRVTIEGAHLNPAVTLTDTALQEIALPTVNINGIGEKEGGVPASDAIALVIGQLTEVAARSSIEAGFLQGMSAEGLKTIQQDLNMPAGLVDQVKGLGEKVKNLFND